MISLRSERVAMSPAIDAPFWIGVFQKAVRFIGICNRIDAAFGASGIFRRLGVAGKIQILWPSYSHRPFTGRLDGSQTQKK